MNGNILKQIRVSLGLSPSEFGDKIGISRQYVWLLETGQRQFNTRIESKICHALRLDEDTINAFKFADQILRSRGL